MESAYAFYRDQFAILNGGSGLFERVLPFGERSSRLIEPLELRSAVRAGVGLGVKAPVWWRLVFFLAGVAHREAAHCGVGAVVRKVEDDAEAWPAMRAVRERIAEAPVGRIEDLREAFVAGREIR